MKNHLKNLFIGLCVIQGMHVSAIAAPITEQSLEKIIATTDHTGLKIAGKLDDADFFKLATQRVQSHLQTDQALTPEQLKAVSEIKMLYQKHYEQKINQIEKNVIEENKRLYQTLHTEESALAQINFLNTTEGRSIAAKQQQRNQLIQDTSKKLPELLSQQKYLQNMVVESIQNGAN